MLFRLVVLSALLAACLAAPVVDSDEIAILSQSQPCRGRIAGTRLRHPTDDHKFLRCVGPESFWIETCPDNLFYNHELDLCDWTVVSETTTAVNDIVKFRPVLFQNNKTVQNVERVEVVPRPAELVNTKMPVRVISSRIRDDTDVAEIRQVPVVVETEEERESEPETVQRRVQTTTVRPVEIVRPVVVESEEPVQVTKVVTPVVETPVVKTPVVVEEEEEVVKPVRVTSVPVVVAKPTPSSVVVEEEEELKPVRVTPVPVVVSKPVPTVELNVVKTVQVTPRPAIETETVTPVAPATQVEEVDVIKPVHVATTVQKPVVVIETEPDFAPKPVKFIARPGVGTRAFGALSSLIGSHPSASVIRTDFIHKLMPVVRA